MKLNQIKLRLKDKETRWYIAILISLLLTILFAVYNGVLGIVSHSIWNGSICFYYLFLVALRIIILINEKKVIKLQDKQLQNDNRRKVFVIISILMFIMSASLFVPITLMVLSQKQLELGLIPAITIAAYTTYKVAMAIINFVKYKKYENLAFRQIRIINLVDAILAILTLQNTLIMVNDGEIAGDMLILAAISSFVATVFIIALPIIALRKVLKEKHDE